MKNTNILIIGTGYVGLSTSAILSEAGYKIKALDLDTRKIDIIKSGKSHFYELGLDELITNGIKKNTLIPTTSYKEGLEDAEIIFSCVGTPDREDGSSNLDYIFSAAESVAKLAKKPFIYVQKSTVPVGTGEKIINLINKIRPDLEFSYISNPEFLREGAAVFDTLNMDRIVVGGNKQESLDKVISLYKSVDELSQKINLKGINKYIKDNNPNAFSSKHKPFEDRVIKTSLESAELIKVSANAFLALKISYANEIATLCEKTGADINEVMNGIGADHRIGRAFLYAGRGYGGGCFPKDVSGLIKAAEKEGVELEIMKSAQKRNDMMPFHIVERLVTQNNGNIEGKNITVLGLAFKTGTSDTRKSPGIKIANTLSKELGAKVTVYDPQAMEEADEMLEADIIRSSTTDEAIKKADIVILATQWEEFTSINIEELKKEMNGNIFVDAVNAMNKDLLIEKGFVYIGVGR